MELGWEGNTDDSGIAAMRRQLVKNFACSLLFSSGTPMILGGDGIHEDQNGNNNAYCQDNEISWFDWNEIGKQRDLIVFSKSDCIHSEYPILQSRKFLAGTDDDGNRIPDISWFGPDGGGPKWDDPNPNIMLHARRAKHVQQLVTISCSSS